MQRVGRLWSPAFAFSVIGLAGVVTAPLPGFQLHGGVLTNGLYVLALQLVVSALAVSVIDDIWDPQLTELRPEHPWQAKGRTREDGPLRFRRALWHFYLWHPLPAALLACGLSISLSLVAMGLLDHNIGVVVVQAFGSTRPPAQIRRSELALGSLLALTVGLTAWRLATGLYGWVAGFAMGVVITEVTLAPDPYPVETVARWATFSAGLLALSLLYALGYQLLSRRRRTVEPA